MKLFPRRLIRLFRYYRVRNGCIITRRRRIISHCATPFLQLSSVRKWENLYPRSHYRSPPIRTGSRSPSVEVSKSVRQTRNRRSVRELIYSDRTIRTIILWLCWMKLFHSNGEYRICTSCVIHIDIHTILLHFGTEINELSAPYIMHCDILRDNKQVSISSANNNIIHNKRRHP